MEFEEFKTSVTDILGDDPGKAVDALEKFKKAIKTQDIETENRLLATMNNLITRQGRNKSKLRFLYVGHAHPVSEQAD